jgi:hypothetical protein
MYNFQNLVFIVEEEKRKEAAHLSIKEEDGPCLTTNQGKARIYCV